MRDSPKRSQKEKPPKLEKYLGTLKLFASSGPMEIKEAQLISPLIQSSKEFASDVDFLAEQQMVQISVNQRRTVCIITDRGTRILSYFKMLQSPFSLEDIEDIEADFEFNEELENDEDDEIDDQKDDKNKRKKDINKDKKTRS